MPGEEVRAEREHTPAGRRWRGRPGQAGGQSSAPPQGAGGQGPPPSPPTAHGQPHRWHFLLPPQNVVPVLKMMAVQHFLEGLLMAYEIQAWSYKCCPANLLECFTSPEIPSKMTFLLPPQTEPLEQWAF